MNKYDATVEKIRLSREAYADLRFLTPPENQGQIVEQSYAADADGIYRRTYDRSDQTESMVFADWADTGIDSFAPWNGAPSVPDDAWVSVEHDQAERG